MLTIFGKLGAGFGRVGAGTPLVPPPEIEHSLVNENSVVATATSHNLGSPNFGVGAAGLVAAITLGSRCQLGVSYSGVTVGGQAATLVAINDAPDGAGVTLSAIALCAIPAGGAQAIVVNFAGGNGVRTGYASFRVLGLPSLTPDATQVADTAAGGDPSVNIDKWANGLVLASLYYSRTNAATLQKYTSASEKPLADATAAAVGCAVDADGGVVWSGITQASNRQVAAVVTAPQALSVASWSPQ